MGEHWGAEYFHFNYFSIYTVDLPVVESPGTISRLLPP